MKKVNLGIIGCGRISDLHAAGYKKDERVCLHTVCDSDAATAGRRQKEWGALKSCTDYRELLSDPEIDAVDIITPQRLHEQMVIEALNAGKHVSVQKPMTVSLASADRMIEAGKKNGKIFRLFENYVFYPPLVLAKKLIDEGAIGTPSTMRFKFLSGSAGGWDVPESAWSWRLDEHKKGYGMQTFDHGHHMWSTAWFLMGEWEWVQSWIDSADGLIDCPAMIIWKFRNHTRYGVCDYTHATELEIPSDYYSCDEWFEISGSKGVILVNRCSGQVKKGPPVSLFSNGGWTHFNDVDDDWASGFAGSARNFISSVLGEEKPFLTGEEGKLILKMDLAIQISSRKEKKIVLDSFSDKDLED